MQVCMYACMYVQNQPHHHLAVLIQNIHSTSAHPTSPVLHLYPTTKNLPNLNPQSQPQKNACMYIYIYIYIYVRSQHTNHPHRKAVLRQGIASTSPLPPTLTRSQAR